MHNYLNLSEKDLIKKSKEQDSKAFEEIISRNSERIWGWICQKTKEDTFLAEEIFQMTLIKCWKNIEKFKEESAFRTWACAIARNLFIDDFRRKQRRKEESLDYISGEGMEKLACAFTEEDPLQNMKNEDLKIFLSKIMDELSCDHKSVLHYFAIEELSYEEISRAMNCSIGTVMSRLFYARKRAQFLIKRHRERKYYVS